MHLDSTSDQAPTKGAIKCQVCPTLFVPKRHWAKFCSPKCRNDYHSKMAPEVLRKDLDALRETVAELRHQLADLEARTAALDSPLR